MALEEYVNQDWLTTVKCIVSHVRFLWVTREFGALDLKQEWKVS